MSKLKHAHYHKVANTRFCKPAFCKLNDLQLAKAMEDARKAKVKGRELHMRGVLESDVHLLFDDKDFAGHDKGGAYY